MNKKFLSAILFGALMVSSTGTFVSCKDYDDDIDNLQGQIDKLATKEDMEAKLAQMQAAIDAAKATAEEALKKAEAGGNADEIADLTKRIEALEKATIDVEALKKELKDAVNEDIDKFRGEMEELIGEVEGLVGKIADLVTSVELVKSYAIDQESGFAPIMLSTAIEQDNEFSKDIAGKITFTKGNEVQTPGQFLVRVSPTNAVLTADMISLVNSQGENLDEILEVVKVEKSDVLLSRAANESGLWNVTVQLKNYGDGKAFDAATTTDKGTKQILFAAQVNNTLSTSDVRYVTSSYDLTLGWKPFKAANELNYFVDTENIKDVNNRYDKSSKSLKETTAAITYKELVWKDAAAVKPTNDNAIQGDNRSDKAVYPAVQGQALKIALSSSEDNVVAPTNIRAIYVVLDKQNAVESAPSELNAWNSYTYTGLNTVVEGTSTEITIDSKSAINDIIGFRVFAVNYDGTLVDPDGKAFYVNLGDASKDWNAVATKITALDPTEVTTVQSALIPVTLTKVNAAKATWATDKIGDNAPIFDAYFVDAEDNVLFSTADLTNIPADFSKVAKVYTKPTIDNWTNYEDDKAYNGTLTLTAATGHVVATMNVSMTKEVPNTLPEGFSLKDKQVINGVYNCYMIADNWTAEAATLGEMPVKNFINFGKGDTAKYEVKLADSQYNADNNKLEAQTVTGDASISVDAEFVNNKTPHATVVSYNYGLVSSKKDADGNFIPVKIKATDFNTVYCCFYKKEIHTWDWATNDQVGKLTVSGTEINYAEKDNKGNYVNELPSTTLVYGSSPEVAYNNFIFGKNAIDGTFSKLLSAPYEGSLVVKSAKLVSDATQKEDYFSVNTDLKFTAIKTDLGSNPKENVPSTLTVTCVDSYGHEVVISLKMTVAPRK